VVSTATRLVSPAHQMMIEREVENAAVGLLPAWLRSGWRASSASAILRARPQLGQGPAPGAALAAGSRTAPGTIADAALDLERAGEARPTLAASTNRLATVEIGQTCRAVMSASSE